MWEIGGDIPGGMVMWTGDGGVVEYCNTFNENIKEAVKQYTGIIDQINEQKEPTNLKLTYKELERIIGEVMFKKEDGMD